jgi:hypothetical protein
LQLFNIENSEVNLNKEISLPELCLQMECNNNYICIASDESYLVINIKSATIQKLFSYDIQNFIPFIANSTEVF